MPARDKSWIKSWGEDAESASQELRAYKKQVNADTNIRLRMIESARRLHPNEAAPTMHRLIRAPLAGLR